MTSTERLPDSPVSPAVPRRSPRLLVVAAEPSADRHAAHVVRALRERRPGIAFGAFGGEALRQAGCEIYEDLTGSASMILGFLRSLGRFYRVLRRFDRLLVDSSPSAVVLVDSPGLNFLLARLARWRGVPVVYYICPQIWAWAPWRRSKVLRWTDFLMAILPFEEELYAGGGVPVRYVGHPLPDELERYSEPAAKDLRERLGAAAGETLIGLFPGSRRQEVEALADVFCAVIRRAAPDTRGLRVAVSCYREEFRPLIEEAGAKHGLELRVVREDARRLMAASDLALVASGTASLELAWFETPMIVLYRTNAIGRWLFGVFRVTPYIALPNILGCVANGDVPTVYEKLFSRDPVEEVAPRFRELLEDGSARAGAVERLRRMKESVLRPGGIEGAATALLAFLDERGLI